jgi:hypothetical protein
MKIGRLVKVMLVLSAVILALNYAGNFNSSSNSRENLANPTSNSDERDSRASVNSSDYPGNLANPTPNSDERDSRASVNSSDYPGNLANPTPNSDERDSRASVNSSAESSDGNFLEMPAEAAPPPSFFQVGRTYGGYFGGLGATSASFTILEIPNTGWVRVRLEGFREGLEGWVNLNAFYFVSLAE